MRRQRVPIGDKEEALVFFLKLKPVLESAEIVAQVKTPGGPHAAQDSFALRHSKENPPPGKWRLEMEQPMLAHSAARPASGSLAPRPTVP